MASALAGSTTADDNQGRSHRSRKWFERLAWWRDPKSAKPSPAADARPNRTKYGLHFLEGINTIIGTLIGGLIVGLVINSWIEARKPVTEIFTIVLPKDWEERGDTAETVIQEVRKRAADAIEGAGRASDFMGQAELHNFEVDLSGNQISTKSLVHFWRDRLYHNRRLLEGGLVAQKDGGWQLWVTLTNGERKRRTTTRTLSAGADRDAILSEFTRVVLATAEQDIYAWLLVVEQKYEEMDRYFWHEVMDDDLTPDRRASFWVARAGSLLIRHRQKDSDQAFREALRYDPDGTATNFVWASMLRTQGRVDEAIQKYEAVIRTDSKHDLAWNNLGRIFYDRGDKEKAIQFFTRAVVANPKCAEGWNNLGSAEMQKDSPDWNRAIEWLLQSIAAKPDYYPALTNLCGAINKQQDARDALPFCQRAQELQPKNLAVLYAALMNLNTLGRRAEAKALADKMLSLKDEATLGTGSERVIMSR